MSARPIRLEEAPLAADAAAPVALVKEASVEALFDKARAGDAGAADALCRALRPKLYRAAFAILRDADEADDVAQEALVKALTARFLLGRPRVIEAWCLRVALNLAKNRGRDKRRRREILDGASHHELSARGSLPKPDDSALERALFEERRARAEAALAALPQRQRDVVRLRLFGGLPFEEVARALDIRVENARVTFSQARKRLEALLQEPASTPELSDPAPQGGAK